MFKKLILLGLFFISIGLSACGLETYQSGDLPPKSRLSAVKTNVHSKEQVLRMLGTPVFINEQDNFFVYGRMRKKSQAFMASKEFEREIYVFYFDKNNLLKKKEMLTLNEAQTVSYVSDTTPTQHRELSITEQLVQNFGRYDAGGRDSTAR